MTFRYINIKLLNDLPKSKCNGANKINLISNAHGSSNKLINSVQFEGTGASSFIGRPHTDAHVRHTGHSIKTLT